MLANDTDFLFVRVIECPLKFIESRSECFKEKDNNNINKRTLSSLQNNNADSYRNNPDR